MISESEIAFLARKIVLYLGVLLRSVQGKTSIDATALVFGADYIRASLPPGA